MLDGIPGVGKTQASKYLAEQLSVPLFRLDVAAMMDKYLGVAESQLASNLDTLDNEAPCVVLIDEIEKVFNTQDDEEKTAMRMLSRLLWWLQEHTSRVMVVMTTNDVKAIPREIYRAGRIDEVMELSGLTKAQAVAFAKQYLKHFSKTKNGLSLPTPTKVMARITDLYGDGVTRISHAEAIAAVKSLIKKVNVKEK